MSVGTATNQEAVVLIERKYTAFVWAGCDFQINLHLGSAIDREIVKGYFVNVAGVETGAATAVVFGVSDAC